MRQTRILAIALAAASASILGSRAEGGNGSNYLHLINGIDYFFGKTPPAGNLVGVWRCFPSSMLHAPTLDLDPANTLTYGTYATRLCALHLSVTGSSGSVIAFPTIALSSSTGTCRFLTSAGAVNFGLFSVSGFGQFVAGPLTGNGGPVPAVNLLTGIAGLSIVNPAVSSIILQLRIDLVGILGQPIAVPQGESLVLWIQDDPNAFGAGTMQYWTGSLDERNLCSSHSFLYSGSSGLSFTFVPAFEWSIGLGTLDATLTTVIRSAGAGPSSLNAHDAFWGFNPGFDQGSGSRTISITGGTLGSEFLGFAVYDEASASGSPRLATANCGGLDLAGPTCSDRSATFQALGGGPGGPVLSTAIPEMPRSVGVIDSCTNALLASAIWIASTNVSTAQGAMNLPWFPVAAGTSGSNASGLSGGFVLPIPPLGILVGAQLWFWSWPVDPTNSYLDVNVNNGHSNTNTYDVLFFP